jgi:hypothetical protein
MDPLFVNKVEENQKNPNDARFGWRLTKDDTAEEKQPWVSNFQNLESDNKSMKQNI